MKTTLTALVLFASATVAFSQVDPEALMTPDLVRMNLRGPVKSVETFAEIPGEGGAAPTLLPVKTERYNRQGWIAEFIGLREYDKTTKYFHTPRGLPILYESQPDSFIFSYIRDSKGRITEQLKSMDTPERRPVMERVVIEYDNGDNPVKLTYYSIAGDGPRRINSFRYDSANRIVVAESLDHQGKLTFNITRSFRPDGTLQTSSVRHGELVPSQTLVHDERGRPVRADGEMGYHTIISYDDEKLEKATQSFHGSELMVSVTEKLDTRGNLLARVQKYSDGMIRQLEEAARKQNGGGLLLGAGSIIALSGMFDRERFTYEYDSRGNWTKRVEFEATEFIVGADNSKAELKPVRTEIRKISYFE